MPMIHISEVTTVYTYETARKAWENAAPRPFHVLAYQVNGHYDHTFPGGVLPVKEDCVLLINKTEPYRVQSFGQGYSICVNFDAEGVPPSLVADCRDNPRVHTLFRRLLQHKNLHQPSNYYLAISLIYEILAMICQRDDRSYLSGDVSRNIRAAREQIHEHYREADFSTTGLAAQCGIGDKYFRTLFKGLYGTTPTQYLINLRLHTAAELLSQGGTSISEAAQTAGFSDVYYFSKLFKQHYSCNPRDYRKRISQEDVLP